MRIALNIGLYGFPRIYWYSQAERLLRVNNELGIVVPNTDVNSLDEFLSYVGVDMSDYINPQQWINISYQIRTYSVDRNENDFMIDRNNEVVLHGRAVFPNA